MLCKTIGVDGQTLSNPISELDHRLEKFLIECCDNYSNDYIIQSIFYNYNLFDNSVFRENTEFYDDPLYEYFDKGNYYTLMYIRRTDALRRCSKDRLAILVASLIDEKHDMVCSKGIHDRLTTFYDALKQFEQSGRNGSLLDEIAYNFLGSWAEFYFYTETFRFYANVIDN